jgi:hypothetical protein
MPSQDIIIAILKPDIVSISKILEEVMKEICAGGDDHVHQFHLDHITDHPAHPPRDHRTRQPQEDDTGRIIEHLSEDIETFKNISALKRSVSEGLDQIEKAFDPFEIDVLDGFLKKF